MLRRRPELIVAPIAIGILALAATFASPHAGARARLSPPNPNAPEALAGTQRERASALVRGRVFDRRSGRGLADADIGWTFDGITRHGFSDADGTFAFRIARRARFGEPMRAASRGPLLLRIVSNLFVPRVLRVPIRAGETMPVEVGLAPKPPGRIGSIRGKLLDPVTRRPIPNATVTIAGAGAVLTTTTGRDGRFAIGTVGFNPNLTVRFTTVDPPCIAPLERPLAVEAAVADASAAARVVELPLPHCPDRIVRPRPLGTSAPAPPMPVDGSVSWQQADDLAIQMNADDDAWNAGHVNDILKFSDEAGGFLAASDTGGVWAIATTSAAIPVSGNWGATAMSSLALGVNGSRDVYAATYPSGISPGAALYETDTSNALPVLTWQLVSPQPPCGSIHKVLLIPSKQRVVLGCDTGIVWSPIPPAPSVHGKYVWTNANPANLQNGTNFSGLAIGPGWSNGGEGQIVASKWSGSTPGDAIYVGHWNNGALQFTGSFVAHPNGTLFGFIGRSTLASCASNPSEVFAIAEDGNNNFAGVWKSTDGGATFAYATAPSNPGGQGTYNQAIAISPDCKIVALGWQNGTFLSYNAGSSWTLLTSSAPHLHSDIHALTFDPSSPSTLYVGSDGGVVSVSNLNPAAGPAFRSDWNRQLLDLQIYHGDGSSAASGLVAAGLQDNGVISSALPNAWQHVTDCGCDGRWSRFFRASNAPAGQSVLTFEEWGAPDWPTGYTVASGNTITYQTGQTLPVSPSPPSSLQNAFTEVVRYPGGYANSAGQEMVAAAAYDDVLYGLFVDDDDTKPNWEPIGKIGGSQNVTALAPTYNGQSIFVGTSQGNIYRFDAPFTSTPAQMTIDAPAGSSGSASVAGLAAIFSSIAYAVVNYGGNGYVMHYDGSTWSVVSGSVPNGLAFTSVVATDIGDAYVSTGGPVYDTHDGGATWNQASNGLPTITQANELRVVADPSGPYLYMETYGRSIWRTRLP